MNYAAPLLSIIAIHLMVVVSPGPAFVATLRVAASNPRRSVILHSLGLGLGAFSWAVGAMLGMQVLMTKAVMLYRCAELAGGIYLIWVGIQSWRNAERPLPVAGRQTAALPDGKAFRQGYLINIANPKVMVFFASIFAAMVPPIMPVWVKVVALIAVGANEGLWYTALAVVFSTSRAQRAYRKAKSSIDRAVSCLMFVFGGKLSWNAVRG